MLTAFSFFARFHAVVFAMQVCFMCVLAYQGKTLAAVGSLGFAVFALFMRQLNLNQLKKQSKDHIHGEGA